MRSSEVATHVARLLGGVLLVTTVTAGCGSSSGVVPASASPNGLSCEATRTAATPAEREVAAALEGSALFGVAVAGTSIAACELRTEDSRSTVRFRFANGSEASASHDAAIETSEQVVRLAVPPRDAEVDLLARAERSAYGPDGCGIDFAHGEPAASSTAGATDKVYRGAACNCQARTSRSATGAIVGLTLRSAC